MVGPLHVLRALTSTTLAFILSAVGAEGEQVDLGVSRSLWLVR